MLIALAPSEISTFLECKRSQLERLWEWHALQRSIFVDGRRNQELSHSSVFDVLEHYLKLHVLPKLDAGEDAEAWLAAVDEFVEQEGWKDRPFEDMVFALMQIAADFVARPQLAETLARVAAHTLSAYFILLSFIDQDP